MSKKKQALQVTDKPIYSYWQALFMSFYSGRLYVDVAKRWKGLGILYLFLLITIVSIPLSARIVYDFHQYFDQQMVMPLAKLPTMYVQNGQVVFDKPMPYFIKNNAGAVVTIVDTTGQITSIDASYPQLTILITKNKLYFRPPKFHLFLDTIEQTKTGDIFVQPMDKSGNEVFDGGAWIESSGILKLRLLTEVIIYPLILMFIYGMYALLMLALAFIGQLFAQIIFKFKLPYKMAARMFLVAATPQIVVFFALLTTNMFFTGVGLLYMVLLAVYFYYAVLCVKRESNKLVRE
jgi:hypothetical protein